MIANRTGERRVAERDAGGLCVGHDADPSCSFRERAAWHHRKAGIEISKPTRRDTDVFGLEFTCNRWRRHLAFHRAGEGERLDLRTARNRFLSIRRNGAGRQPEINRLVGVHAAHSIEPCSP